MPPPAVLRCYLHDLQLVLEVDVERAVLVDGVRLLGELLDGHLLPLVRVPLHPAAVHFAVVALNI